MTKTRQTAFPELFYATFSIKQECVPVILSDQAELPFQNVIDYTQISIKWPSTHIGTELLDYLESIPGQHTAFLVLASCIQVSSQ